MLHQVEPALPGDQVASTNRIVSSVAIASNTPALMAGAASAATTAIYNTSIMIFGLPGFPARPGRRSAVGARSDMSHLVLRRS